MVSPFTSAVTKSGTKTHILNTENKEKSLCGLNVEPIEAGTSEFPYCIDCSRIFNDSRA